MYSCNYTIGDMQNEMYFYDHYNEFVYNHDYVKLISYNYNYSNVIITFVRIIYLICDCNRSEKHNNMYSNTNNKICLCTHILLYKYTYSNMNNHIFINILV